MADRRRVRLALACAGTAALLAGCSSGPGAAAPSAPAEGASSSVATTAMTGTGTTGATPGTGRSSPPPVTSPGSVAWKAALHGAVYAQPVVVGGRVFVATEDDYVYALALTTGRVIWRASVGSPLTHVQAYAGCGDIDPLGITSTPVVDRATGTLYVVGETSDGADPPSVARRLFGLDMATGRVISTADADPTGGGDRQIDLLQRPALVLDAGRVDVAFGGLFGDCGYYHGWVVGVPVAPGVARVEFDTTAGGSGGAIWQGGGPPAVDASGNLYMVTGNQNSQGTAGYYESVVKLSPQLVPEASFRDPAATGDEDFGSTGPLLLPDGTLFAVGKTDVGYVLSQSDLRPVSRIPGVCGSDPDGRVAYDASTDAVYVPCRDGGIQEVDLRTRRLGWKAGEANSSPVLAAGSLWALSYPAGTLEELDPLTGAVKQTTGIGPTANFATPAYADGYLLAAGAAGTVVAFKA